MHHRLLPHPTLRQWLRTITAAGFFTMGCGSQTQATDTRTNWLEACSDDTTCSDGLACLCGVCTQLCQKDNQCSTLASGAGCFDAPQCPAPVCAKSLNDLRSGYTPDDAGAATDSETSSTDPDSGSPTTEPNTASSTSTGPNTASSTSIDSEAPDANAMTSGEPLIVSNDAGTESAQDDASVALDCDLPGRMYTGRSAMECVTSPDCGVLAEGVGNVPFSDECGCGCEPYQAPPRGDDSIRVEECNPGPSLGSVEYTLIAESSFDDPAFCTDLPNAIIRDQQALTEWGQTSGCSAVVDAIGSVDFSTLTLLIATSSQQPDAKFDYLGWQIDGTLHFGIRTEAYCGGAAPPSGYVVVAFAAPESLSLVVNTCTQECQLDGGLPKP